MVVQWGKIAASAAGEGKCADALALTPALSPAHGAGAQQAIFAQAIRIERSPVAKD
jgi:hypothetical protein